MNTQMSISVSQKQGRVPVTVFRIKGEINVNTYEEFQAKAQEAFKSGTRNLLLDLTDVSYISSAGVRGIHAVFTMLRAGSGESDDAISKGLRDGSFKSPHLKLLNPSASVAQVLKTMGLDMYLEIYQDLERAVASFG